MHWLREPLASLPGSELISTQFQGCRFAQPLASWLGKPSASGHRVRGARPVVCSTDGVRGARPMVGSTDRRVVTGCWLLVRLGPDSPCSGGLCPSVAFQRRNPCVRKPPASDVTPG